MKIYNRELQETQELFDRCLQRGLYYLKEARVVYSEMESYYQESMDFEAVESRRKEVLDLFLKIIDEKK